MTDIVERLRHWAQCQQHDLPRIAQTCVDGAAEIVWLRGERNRLAADLAKAHREALAWMQKASQPAGESRERESPAAREEAAHG